MTPTFTQEHKAKLEEYLATHTLPNGLGSPESACSIAAINLAMTGTLTDAIPDCMSEVLGRTTTKLQDAMPDGMRNSLRYKALLPNMAGTGREHEQERLDILLEWLWSVVLPQLQPVADENGFGTEWENMCKLKTADSARAAHVAAYTSRAITSWTVAVYTALTADTADATARAEYAADTAASAAAASADFWETVDPIGVLERMTYLNVEKTNATK